MKINIFAPLLPLLPPIARRIPWFIFNKKLQKSWKTGRKKHMNDDETKTKNEWNQDLFYQLDLPEPINFDAIIKSFNFQKWKILKKSTIVLALCFQFSVFSMCSFGHEFFYQKWHASWQHWFRFPGTRNAHK